RRPDARHQAKRVDARRVRVRALDVAVPRHRRGHARVLGAHVERERTAAAEAGDAEPVGARPALLLGVVGSDRDVAEVLRPGHFAGDRAHLLEVLPLHPALALVELRRDRVIAGVREAPDHVLVVLTVAGEAGDHDDHGVATRCLRAYAAIIVPPTFSWRSRAVIPFVSVTIACASEIPGVRTPPTVVYAPNFRTSLRLSGLAMRASWHLESLFNQSDLRYGAGSRFCQATYEVWRPRGPRYNSTRRLRPSN